MTKPLKEVVRRGVIEEVARRLKAGEQLRLPAVRATLKKRFPTELAGIAVEGVDMMLDRMIRDVLKKSQEILQQSGAQYEMGMPGDLVGRLPPAVSIPEGKDEFYWRSTSACTDDELRLAAENLEKHARDTWAKAAALREYLLWRDCRGKP
jgi:hypothetical protein